MVIQSSSATLTPSLTSLSLASFAALLSTTAKFMRLADYWYLQRQGAIALQRTPNVPYWNPTFLANPTTAGFAAVYALSCCRKLYLVC